MKCKLIKEQLLEMASGTKMSGEAEQHVSECANCATTLKNLRSTMSLLDEWKTPEPSAYFDSRMRALVRAESEAIPGGWRARVLDLGLGFCSQPIGWRAAVPCALGLIITIGAGIYKVNISSPQTLTGVARVQRVSGGAVADLERLEKDKELLAALDSLDEVYDNSSGSEY